MLPPGESVKDDKKPLSSTDHHSQLFHPVRNLHLVCVCSYMSICTCIYMLHICIQNLLNPFSFTYVYTCPGLIIWNWTAYVTVNPKRKLILLSSNSLLIALHLEVQFCKISSIHLSTWYCHYAHASLV